MASWRNVTRTKDLSLSHNDVFLLQNLNEASQSSKYNSGGSIELECDLEYHYD